MMADRTVLLQTWQRPCRWARAWAPFRPATPSPRSSTARRTLTVTAAKKGGKGSKKGPGSAMDVPKPAQQPTQAAPAKEPYTDARVIMHNLLLIESHYRKVGRPILEGEVEISQAARTLWEAPFAVLAHDGHDTEAKFVYGNKAALALFECTWEELVGTPSTQSAEAVDEIQSERAQVLAAACERGYIEGYEGWRVSFKGKRFKIKRATLFNVEAPSGDAKGQAAVIREWEFEDGTKGGEGVEPGAAAGSAPPTAEELQAAEAAVAEQAAAVRQLKDERGLTNADTEVKEAVAELLSRKEKLEQMQRHAVAAASAEAAKAAAADGTAGADGPAEAE